MTSASGTGTPYPIQASLGDGHGDHGTSAGASSPHPGLSFSTALARAVARAPSEGAERSSGHATISGSPNGHPHSRHFQIGEFSHGGEQSLQETALGLRAYRQQLIASNIANADTPGYKAADIDFHEALHIARSIANMPPLTLSATASGHFSGQAGPSVASYPLKYHIPAQPSADGNTVEMDVERSKFAENSMMWEFARDRVSGHFKHLMETLQNLKD